jgi:hypothetical protein
MKIKKAFRSVILLLIVLVNIVPINIYAQDVTVGLDIEGEIILSAVTTLNSNIKIDVMAMETTTSYIRTSNTGNSSIDVSIINIAPVGVDIPDNFLTYGTSEPITGKTWIELNEAETKEYIAFGVSKNGWDYETILPNQSIKLGRITRSYAGEEFGTPLFSTDENALNLSPSRSFGISAQTGFLWGSTTNASYNITTMIELSVENEIINTPKHLNIENVYSGANGSFNDVLYVGSHITAAEAFVFDYQKFAYTGSVTSPSNEVTYFSLGLASDGYSEDLLEGSKYIFSSVAIPDFIMDEYGTYYIQINFGFIEESQFIVEDNYSTLVSITLAE